MTRHAEAGPIQFGPFRRLLIRRFPFGVFYTVEASGIVVHGVFHLSRDPNRIRELLESEGGEPTV